MPSVRVIVAIDLNGRGQQDHQHRPINDPEETEQFIAAQGGHQDQGRTQIGIFGDQFRSDNIVDVGHNQNVTGQNYQRPNRITHNELDDRQGNGHDAGAQRQR